MTDFEKTIQELYSFIDYEKLVKPQPYDTTEEDLAKFRAVLADRGNPQFKYRTIHIAGSKGKGSTAAICESILRYAGYKTGLYTSPHLIDIRERIKIDGKAISKSDFVDKISELVKYAREIGVPKGYRTVFEIMTAAAFEYFAEKGIDFSIIECGLGGKIDATNVLRPSASVITTVGLDHTAILGDTIGEIAADKAYIIKPQTPVILGPQEDEARDVIYAFARDNNAPVFAEINKNVLISSIRIDENGTTFDLKFDDHKFKALNIPLIGEFQASNAATAVVTVLSLRNTAITINETDIRQGLKNVDWPGRMQLFREEPDILVDGAHSPMAIEAIIRSMRTIWPDRKLIFIFAANRDKDIGGMLRPISKEAKSLILTRFDWPRAAKPSDIALLVEGAECDVIETNGLNIALEKARNIAAKDDLIVITGSLYLAGEALKSLGYRIE